MCLQEKTRPREAAGVWIWKERAPRARLLIKEGFSEKEALEPSQRKAKGGKGPRQEAQLEPMQRREVNAVLEGSEEASWGSNSSSV